MSTGKAIQWRGPGDPVNRRTLKTEKSLSSSPSRKSALTYCLLCQNQQPTASQVRHLLVSQSKLRTSYISFKTAQIVPRKPEEWATASLEAISVLSGESDAVFPAFKNNADVFQSGKKNGTYLRWIQEGFAVEPRRHDSGASSQWNDSSDSGPKVRVTGRRSELQTKSQSYSRADLQNLQGPRMGFRCFYRKPLEKPSWIHLTHTIRLKIITCLTLIVS